MNTPSRRTVIQGAGAAVATTAFGFSVAPRAVAAGSMRIAIIGSGYGGAVAARQLTAAGYTVDMIEMGTDWRSMPPKANGRIFDMMSDATGRSSWFKTRTDAPFSSFFGLDVVNKNIPAEAGVLDTVQFSNFKVYRGIGFGGGSLVNGGMAVTPRRTFLGQVMPQLDLDEMYSTYFPRANAELGVTVPPNDILSSSPWYQFTRTSAVEVGKAGNSQVVVPNVYDWNYLRQESYNQVPKSALAQEVIYGNNYGKKSLDKTILKTAFATGRVNLIPLTEVTSIAQRPDGTFDLALKTITYTGTVTSQRTATYDRVVLAAGSVGTCKLLVTAKNTGTIANLPAATGQNWGPNGNVMLSKIPWLISSSRATGANQSGIPAQGVFAWDDSAKSVFAEVAPLPVGFETYTNIYLALTNNPNLGAFVWNSATKSVDLTWNQTMHAPSVLAAQAVFDKINSATASYYRSDIFQNGRRLTDYFTYHPLGGMVLGKATDLNGEVLGVPGLFVMDGSLVPGKLGVNPFVTITALAERNMDRLIAGRRFA